MQLLSVAHSARNTVGIVSVRNALSILFPGEFGIVYKGLLKKGFSEGYSESVAVKTLKGTTQNINQNWILLLIEPLGFMQDELVKDLLKECVKMQEFDHPNVLKLLGVCLDGGPAPYIIMPFMANGSLLSYLKHERDNLILESPNAEDMVLFGRFNVHCNFSLFCLARGAKKAD